MWIVIGIWTCTAIIWIMSFASFMWSEKPQEWEISDLGATLLAVSTAMSIFGGVYLLFG